MIWTRGYKLNLHNRLEKLEAKAGIAVVPITAIFNYFVHSVNGKRYQVPIAGLRTYEGEVIMRLEGESEENLAERAKSIAKANSGNNTILSFIQIDGEDENIYE